MLGTMYDEENLFQQRFDDQLWTNLTVFMQNMRDLPIWKDRSMAATIFGGKQNYDFWKKIFADGETPDGTKVMAKGINYVEMIKK